MLRWLDRHFEEFVACTCIAAVACFVFLQVILRYVFNSALVWTEELSGFAMVWTVYMGASLAVRERFHVRIMAGVVALPRRLAIALVVLADLAWLGFNLFMIQVGLEYLAVLRERPSASPSLGIDMLWPESIVVIGYVLMTLRLLQIYVRWWLSDRKELPGLSAEYQTPARAGESP
ncbi:MAG: TRAP transporter small permease [Gammaproteobacteria bacterium]|nr:TRAP transporter small permease [Gammaproteobacteria bacterium]MBU1441146.1 TRAP transporter small permease [Gammaproteobacteria bacterium]MBU2287751.1 TRAP transporter small permease [Gammaproteobacteria bacterium]MBU2407518.1 TRAP transporter small permease [Gammaproteobacteria bacterium]